MLMVNNAEPSPLIQQIPNLTNVSRDVIDIPFREPHSCAPQDVSIILDTSQETLLGRCDGEQFGRLQDFILNNKTIFWITREGDTAKDSSMVSGFTRTIRSENPHLELYTVGLSPSGDNVVSVNHMIYSIQSILDSTAVHGAGTSRDYEYQELEGCLHIHRVTEDFQATVALRATSGRAEPSEQLLNQAHRPLRLVVDTPGVLDSLHFTDYAAVKEPLADNEILLEVRAVGVNFRDLMVALGQLQASDRMGGECSGVVRAVGSFYASTFQPGDRVTTWGTHTAYASLTRTKRAMTRHISEGMAFSTAASIPIAFTTAWYALVDKARLSQGNTVLIHSAAGGVGQAAIQIALHLGATVFATVGSDTKRNFLCKHYGIADSQIFSSRSTSFVDAIKRSTKGQGVDVVLNSLSGDLLQGSISCSSIFGTFIELGKRDILANSRLEMKVFGCTRTFTAIDMLDIFDHNPAKGGHLLQEVL